MSKNIWITGGSTGIGKAIAASFAQENYNVFISSRNREKLTQTALELMKFGRITEIPCDVRSEKSVSRAFREIEENYGAIHILINNAGVGVFKPFMELTISDFDTMIETNLRGAFLCMKSVLPAMIEQKNGVIVNILSIAATKTFAHSSGYSASKAGLLAMSRTVREEVREFGIKIVDVLPGATATNIWSENALTEFSERMMQPYDVAEIIISLLKSNPRTMPEEIIIRPQLGDLP